MPERFPTKNPQVICGTPVESGTPNTGQVQFTLGGQKTFSALSGVVGPDILIHAGGGRLDAAFFHDSAILALSGQPIVFYDSAVAVSGGPLATSGHKVVGVLAPDREFAATGISGAALRGGNVRSFGFTYYSGLVHTTRSGAAGFSVSYTPVVSN